jgi:DNA-directed RNA polymerase subunit RPC12/RpoP
MALSVTPAILEQKAFNCSECDREFELDYQLELHMKNVHGSISPHKCGICGRGFNLMEQLEMHTANYVHISNEIFRNDYQTDRFGKQSRKLY